jgi:dTDP-4-dehydrorhamnose reductase
MKRIAVTGARGMLGRAFREVLAGRDAATRFAGVDECDIRSAESVRAFIDDRVEAILNCAAWTDVDGAEADEPSATAVNGDGVGILAARAREVGAVLVHFSTDYVFDGRATLPYPIDAPRAPINAYGRSKARGEELLEASGATYLLVRTSWVYAPWGKNFVRTIAEAARQRPVLRVVNDQRGRPTSATELARRSLALLEAGVRGTFHVCDAGEATWFDLATHVAEIVAPSCRVEPCTSEEFPRPARRPAYSVLDTSRCDALLGPAMAWQEAVHAVLLDPLVRREGMGPRRALEPGRG